MCNARAKLDKEQTNTDETAREMSSIERGWEAAHRKNRTRQEMQQEASLKALSGDFLRKLDCQAVVRQRLKPCF